MELIFIILLLITNGITLAFLIPSKLNHSKQLKSLHLFYKEHLYANDTIHDTRLNIKNKQIETLEQNLNILRNKNKTI
jgi:hypothetical protein